MSVRTKQTAHLLLRSNVPKQGTFATLTSYIAADNNDKNVRGALLIVDQQIH